MTHPAPRESELQRAIRQRDEAEAQVEAINAAVLATLDLADSLAEMAAQGAGFVEHWGERVLQAVRPLRDVQTFKDKTLAHNQVLLESNTELVAQVEGLRVEVAQLRTQNEQLLELSMGLEEHPEGYDGPCMCKLCMSYAD